MSIANSYSVLVTTPADRRERAGSLRELVEQSTPIESNVLAVSSERFGSVSSRQQPCYFPEIQDIISDLSSRSPEWVTSASPESATYPFEPLPSNAEIQLAPELYHIKANPCTSSTATGSHFTGLHALGHATANADVHARTDPFALQQPMQVLPAAATMPQNVSPERNIMGYRELVRGITLDLEKICYEHVLINISTNTAGSESDLAFLDLVIAHMGSRDAAAYVLKRTDLQVALVTGLVWRQISTYILSKPVLDKAPSRSAAAFYHAWLDETFAHAYDADNFALRQTLIERRASFVEDIQRAPEYQAFVKTFATQVANDVVRDLMPVWRSGSAYKVGQVLIDKVTTRMVRLISRMRAEAKVFYFAFYSFGTPFNSASMSKRNPDLLFAYGHDEHYAVMCDIAPAVFEMDMSAGQLETKPIYLAEVLVHDTTKHVDEALDQVKLYGPMPVPAFGGRRRSRRKTGTAPFLIRRDSATMQDATRDPRYLPRDH